MNIGDKVSIDGKVTGVWISYKDAAPGFRGAKAAETLMVRVRTESGLDIDTPSKNVRPLESPNKE